MIKIRLKKQDCKLCISLILVLVVFSGCRSGASLLQGIWTVSSVEVLLSEESKLMDSAMSGFYENELRKYFPEELNIHDTLSFQDSCLTINNVRRYRFYSVGNRLSIVYSDMVFSYVFESSREGVSFYREKYNDRIYWHLTRYD